MFKKLKFAYILLLFICLNACNSEDQTTQEDAILMAGKRAFNKCQSCHEITRPRNKVGPHLVGILNRESGAIETFSYSLAMRSANIVWNEENLDKYIESPRTFLPYNRMSFIGIKNPAERAALITYLKQITVSAEAN